MIKKILNAFLSDKEMHEKLGGRTGLLRTGSFTA